MRALRWVLILPAALLAIVTVTFPVHWLTLLLMHQNSFLHFMEPETLARLLRAGIVPGVFVTAGAFTAPGYRVRTAVVLGVLLTAAIPLLLLFVAGIPNAELADPPALWVLKGVLSLASIVAAVVYVYRSEYF